MIVQETIGRDAGTVHYQVRETARGVEVRIGGVWVALNRGEYVELVEDDAGRLNYR